MWPLLLALQAAELGSELQLSIHCGTFSVWPVCLYQGEDHLGDAPRLEGQDEAAFLDPTRMWAWREAAVVGVRAELCKSGRTSHPMCKACCGRVWSSWCCVTDALRG